MSVFVALYRGINVGGKHSVKMESLRAMHEQLGHANVTSYVQSGNVVFSATGTAAAIARRIAAKFAEQCGFAAHVMVMDAQKWAKVVGGNPYAKFAAEDPQKVHLAMCAGRPDVTGLARLLTKTGGCEQFTAGKDFVYLHAPDGFGTSKFAAGMERAAGVPLTVRNWRTVAALSAMAEAMI